MFIYSKWNGSTTYHHGENKRDFGTDYGICCWYTPQLNFRWDKLQEHFSNLKCYCKQTKTTILNWAEKINVHQSFTIWTKDLKDLLILPLNEWIRFKPTGMDLGPGLELDNYWTSGNQNDWCSICILSAIFLMMKG